MNLPVINQPTYELYMHSIKKNVEYRPFTVGEEKILMMVSESEDAKFAINNMKKVVDACILDPNVNTTKLATYDVENLLLKIRAKSSGEIVEVVYKDEETENTYNIVVDLEAIDVIFPEDHEYVIKVSDDVSIKMKDLTFDKVLDYQINKKMESSVMYDMILDCVDSIVSGEDVFTAGEDITRKELEDFISSLSGVSNKFYNFIKTMPSLEIRHTADDGKEIVIKDVRNFLK